MSNFVKITNPAGDIDRRWLEKLGISSKRDDESTIGQFGSGAKFAPIAALRKGIRWITVAKDVDGPYTMEYVAREVDGIETVFYKYGDIEKESSFTVDAGLLSWDEDFQIFREAFANAVDSGEEYSIDMVDEIEDYEEGFVSVYLSAHPAVVDIIKDFNKYFLFKRTPIVELEYGSVYDNHEPNTTFMYNKGVLVDQRSFDLGFQINSFDWGFKTLTLNEERRIRHYWEVEDKIAKILINMPDDQHGDKFVTQCIENEPAEFTHVLNTYSIGDDERSIPKTKVWMNAWVRIFGEDTIPLPKSAGSEVVCENLRIAGYRSRFTSVVLSQLLYNSGIPRPQDLLGDKSNIKTVECPSEHVKVLEHAMRTVSRYDSRIEKYKISIMEDPGNLGLAVMGQGEEEIFISVDCLDLGFRKIVGTLVHELDHVNSGVSDQDYRKFRNLADERIVELMLDAGYDDDLLMSNGCIVIELNYLSALGTLEYEVISSDMGSLLRIGDKRFFVDATMESGKGVMKVSGDQLVIEDDVLTAETAIKKV